MGILSNDAKIEMVPIDAGTVHIVTGLSAND